MTCSCAASPGQKLLRALPSFSGHHIPLPCRGRRHLEHVAHFAISREIRLAPCLHRLEVGAARLRPLPGTSQGFRSLEGQEKVGASVSLLHGGVCGCTDRPAPRSRRSDCHQRVEPAVPEVRYPWLLRLLEAALCRSLKEGSAAEASDVCAT